MQRRANGKKYQGPFCLVSILDKEIILKADYGELDAAGIGMLWIRSGIIKKINNVNISLEMRDGILQVRDKTGAIIYHLEKSCLPGRKKGKK